MSSRDKEAIRPKSKGLRMKGAKGIRHHNQHNGKSAAGGRKHDNGSSNNLLNQDNPDVNREVNGYEAGHLSCPLCGRSHEDPASLGAHLISAHGGNSIEYRMTPPRRQLTNEARAEARKNDNTPLTLEAYLAQSFVANIPRMLAQYRVILALESSAPQKESAKLEAERELEARKLCQEELARKLTEASRRAERAGLLTSAKTADQARCAEESREARERENAGRQAADLQAWRLARIEKYGEIDVIPQTIVETCIVEDTRVSQRTFRALREQYALALRDAQDATRKHSTATQQEKHEATSSAATKEKLKEAGPLQQTEKQQISAGGFSEDEIAYRKQPAGLAKSIHSQRRSGWGCLRPVPEQELSRQEDRSKPVPASEKAQSISINPRTVVLASEVEAQCTAGPAEILQRERAQNIVSATGSAVTKPLNVESDYTAILAKLAAIRAERDARDEVAHRAHSTPAENDSGTIVDGPLSPNGPDVESDTEDVASESSDLITL